MKTYHIKPRNPMLTIQVKPVRKGMTKAMHNELAESLPIYDTVRRWLELQPNVIREGCQPVQILRELVELCALFTDGDIQYSEFERAVQSLLS